MHNPMMTDAQFEAVVQEYMPRIYAYVRRYTGNIDSAADITQETFVKAWKNLKRYDPAQPMSAWLYTIAKRTAIDWLRKRRDEQLPDEIIDTAPSLTESLDATRRTETVLSAVAQLPNGYRDVVQLRLDDLQFHEIADRLKKPLNTVKSQYRRALQLLRRMHQKG